MKIYHVLAHSLELLFPDIGKSTKKLQHLDHAVTRYIHQLMVHDDTCTHVLVTLSTHIKTAKTLRHKDGYQLIVLPAYKLIYPLEYSPALRAFIKKTDDGIIHLHGTSSFVYDSIASLLKHKPSIAHYRGGHFTWKAFPVSFVKYVLLQPFTLKYPSVLFVENKLRMKKFHKQYGIPEHKMYYIPGAIDPTGFSVGKRTGTNLLFAGRLTAAKGVPELLAILPCLLEKYPHLKLHIAGDGALRQHIIAAAKTLPLVYHGSLGQNEMKKLYADADVFILPTHSDSFGLVLIEAMSARLPVISTTVEGPSDIVEHERTGLLIPPRHVAVLKNSVERLLADEALRQRMGSAGYKKVLAEFTWNRVTKKIIAAYRKINTSHLNKKTPPSA